MKRRRALKLSCSTQGTVYTYTGFFQPLCCYLSCYRFFKMILLQVIKAYITYLCPRWCTERYHVVPQLWLYSYRLGIDFYYSHSSVNGCHYHSNSHWLYPILHYSLPGHVAAIPPGSHDSQNKMVGGQGILASMPHWIQHIVYIWCNHVNVWRCKCRNEPVTVGIVAWTIWTLYFKEKMHPGNPVSLPRKSVFSRALNIV